METYIYGNLQLCNFHINQGGHIDGCADFAWNDPFCMHAHARAHTHTYKHSVQSVMNKSRQVEYPQKENGQHLM
jgi:hypothetical protein